MLHWIAIGRCLRRFHELGVCHADLNAHNILIGTGAELPAEPVPPDAPLPVPRYERVFLIDFDRGTLRKPGFWKDDNLVRLRRSLEKISLGPAARALHRG